MQTCKRIDGIWFVEDVKTSTDFPMVKIYCAQGDAKLVHVIFESETYIEKGNVVELKGWQNI